MRILKYKKNVLCNKYRIGYEVCVNFMGILYSSKRLCKAKHLIGKSIILLVDGDDLRKVFAYQTNGLYLDTLLAVRKFGVKKYSIEEHQEELKKKAMEAKRENNDANLNIYCINKLNSENIRLLRDNLKL